EHRVAVHAHARRRDSGVTARSRAVVTIETRDPIRPRVDGVRKRDGLLRRIPLLHAELGEGRYERPSHDANADRAAEDERKLHHSAFLTVSWRSLASPAVRAESLGPGDGTIPLLNGIHRGGVKSESVSSSGQSHWLARSPI